MKGQRLDIESVPIDSVHPDPANVRRHPERNLAGIKASLARFGQQRPILVDGNGIIRAGNGTHAAARELGWESISIVRTTLAGSEATAYAIADNRTAELAEWDDTALADTLRALQSEDFDLDAVGYTGDEVDALIERLGSQLIVPEPEPQKEPELKAEHFVEIYCSANDLDEFRSTLDAWGQRAGCTVNIS
jgi:ParB-like chromosome segregation protein Spo0J